GAACSRGRDRTSEPVGDAHEGDHVARVVLQDRRDDRRIALSEVMEVCIGNEPAGNVCGPTVVENALLQLLQRGRPESVAPEPPRGMQEVQVRVVHSDLAAYGHDKPCANDWEVERLVGVGRASTERFALSLELIDELSLRTV